MQLGDEVPLSGETVSVSCSSEDCMNKGVTFEVPVELPAVCGPCGQTLHTPTN